MPEYRFGPCQGYRCTCQAFVEQTITDRQPTVYGHCFCGHVKATHRTKEKTNVTPSA